MGLRMVRKFTTLLFLCLFLASCGGGNTTGGGVAEFKTVTVSAQASTPRLESDVVSGNTCTAGVSSGGTFATDNVDVTITSTIYPKFTGTTSSVEIDSYTVKFTPANASSAALADVQGSIIGTTVTAGGTLTIPIAVAPEIMKYALVNEKNLQACSATMYQYYATITFNGLELNTGTRATFQTSLSIAFVDRL